LSALFIIAKMIVDELRECDQYLLSHVLIGQYISLAYVNGSRAIHSSAIVYSLNVQGVIFPRVPGVPDTVAIPSFM
jgi:hypothetical protein